jgi:acid stress-induced BolA-like protein IbaG/YrbA
MATTLTVTRLREVLQRELEADASDVDETSPGGRVSGLVVAPVFSGKDQVERQRLVWGVLRRHLEAEVLAHVGLLMTLTPAELAAAREA